MRVCRSEKWVQGSGIRVWGFRVSNLLLKRRVYLNPASSGLFRVLRLTSLGLRLGVGLDDSSDFGPGFGI